MRKLPSLTALRAFEAAARHLSFKAAGYELNLTPTAISHQIRLLEEFCEHPLFCRRPRPLSLTSAGARLFPVIKNGLDAFATALTEMKEVPANASGAAQQGTLAPRTASPIQSGTCSIAVLPLANLSGDANQEFFSDGMTDEITSALAKVRDLRVVGRSSAFQFKGQNKDLRAIGKALSTRYLIDGSVRKAGDRVRIASQLVEAENGVQLWSETYDRQLTDIFAIQEDIAQAIAVALRVPLGLRQGEGLVRNRTNDAASYDDYLRAKALFRARGLDRLTEAAKLLEQVVARNPDFAPGWALMAQVYDKIPTYDPALNSGSVNEGRRVVDASLPRAEAAARRAIELDADLADGYVSLGLVQRDRWRLLPVEDLFKQALALDPNNPEVLHFYGEMLAEVGRLKEALAMLQHLRALEPFVPVFNLSTALVLAETGQNDAAIAMLRAMPPDDVNRAFFLPAIYAAAGRYSEAADALLSAPSGLSPREMEEEAARLLRTAPVAAGSRQTLPRLGGLGYVYLYVGAPDRVLESYEARVEVGYSIPADTGLLWLPSYAPVRQTERFKAFVRAAGIVEYWRAKGWPDLCRPAGADDFVCD